jgi:hypothetical protein
MNQLLHDYPCTIGGILAIPISAVALYALFHQLNGLIGVIVIIAVYFTFETHSKRKRRLLNGYRKNNQTNESEKKTII